MNTKRIAMIVVGLLLITGCNIPGGGTPAPTPTPLVPPELIFITTETPAPITPVIPTSAFTPTATPIPPVAANVCADPQAVAVIDSLKAAMQTRDGKLFSSLVSPNGIEVRYFRDADPIKYTAHQALFLFETTFEANWGTAPASGLEKTGSFHDVIVPELVKIFHTSYTLHCNEIRHGGASYQVTWPYSKDFYSMYYAGTDQNGYLDWQTWVAGIEYVNGKPYLYALTQFFWEP